jgi:acyl-ACP thioesterase
MMRLDAARFVLIQKKKSIKENLVTSMANPDAPPRRLLHTSRQIVRWGDMDFYGHVNNTVYFRYFEQARVEWLEQAGFVSARKRTPGP